MSTSKVSPLAEIEPRLRGLLPADLYAAAWLEPSPENLTLVFEHLRTLRFILYDYVPRQVSEKLPQPGQLRHTWAEGTLMFTDLVGFTALMEANAARGAAGARTLLGVLNSYFSKCLEVISKSGGTLLEFTGDALLVAFNSSRQGSNTDAIQAVRAGLRMQRAMKDFEKIETDAGNFSLGMRVGVHSGRFFSADIGTPRRMEHVMLGNAVHETKKAESVSKKGRVTLTETTYERVKDEFKFEAGETGYHIVMDDEEQDIGEFELVLRGRRLPTVLLLDRTVEGLVTSITESLEVVEVLASFIPNPILRELIESAAAREIPPDFPKPAVVFVNLTGLAESVDKANELETEAIVEGFSRILTLVNAAVEARGGVLKKVTYHLAGSDMMIFFGTPTSHTDDAVRAVEAALAIREIIQTSPGPMIQGEPIKVGVQIGIAKGSTFSGEIGEPRGRREFNVLGDTVNTAARLMARAAESQILITQPIYAEISGKFECESIGAVALKGKSAPQPLFSLKGPLVAEKVKA